MQLVRTWTSLIVVVWNPRLAAHEIRLKIATTTHGRNDPIFADELGLSWLS